ncbi:hypothetical protein NECID01_0114 [Nematocida sp. AWRm77]|nr:hypothetical protein NECID01_0114 [Nematocida sp. AWRm77]
MPGKKEEKLSFRSQTQASRLSEQMLSQFRRDSKEWVHMDEDSMENIDTYWMMANKELKEMENAFYEDTQQALTPHKEKAKAVMGDKETKTVKTVMPVMGDKEDTETKTVKEVVGDKEPKTVKEVKEAKEVPRKSFDEEFEKNLDNVILSGFSDSSDETDFSKEALPSSEPRLRKKTTPQRMSFLPEPVVLNTVIKNTVLGQEDTRTRSKKETKPKRKAAQRALLSTSADKQRLSKSMPPQQVKKRKLASQKKSTKKGTSSNAIIKPGSTPQAFSFGVVGSVGTKDILNGVILETSALSVKKVTVGKKKQKKLAKDQMYYVLKGSLVVSQFSSESGERSVEHTYSYKDTEYTGRILKAGSVFHSRASITVYNPGVYPCALLGVQSLLHSK